MRQAGLQTLSTEYPIRSFHARPAPFGHHGHSAEKEPNAKPGSVPKALSSVCSRTFCSQVRHHEATPCDEQHAEEGGGLKTQNHRPKATSLELRTHRALF